MRMYLISDNTDTCIGMKLAGVKIPDMFKSKKMYYVSALKLVLLPVIGVAIAIGATELFSLPVDLVLATFVCFAMPTAGLASTLADQHDGDVEGAVFYGYVFGGCAVPGLAAGRHG